MRAPGMMLALLGLVAPLLLGADRDRTEIFHGTLTPTTGFNDLCGEPVMPGVPNLTFSAAHNPDGPDPIPLTPEFCAEHPDAVLATWANPVVYGLNGWELPDQRLVNVPYHEVQLPTGWDGRRAFLPDQGPGVGQPLPPTRAAPNPPWTVDSFLGVEGTMRLRCRPDGSARVWIRGSGYQPNVVLTLWLVWGNAPDSGLPPVLPQPLGGLPNTTSADEDGRFRFERELSFCPMHDDFGLSTPLAIDVASHLDGVTYGSFPENPLAEFTFVDGDTGELFTSRGVGAGIVGLDQGVIPLLGAP